MISIVLMGSFLSDVIEDIVPHWLCILFFGGSFKPLGLTGKKNNIKGVICS